MLKAVYTCTSGTPIRAEQYGTPPSLTGLCGRVVRPPPAGVLEEMRTLLGTEGWPEDNLPNSSMPWIDVQPGELPGEMGAFHRQRRLAVHRHRLLHHRARHP